MFTLGIAGGSGSGKSTLIERIKLKFSAGVICHIPMDAYYKDHSHLTPKQKKVNNFDHPDAIDFRLLCSHIQQLNLGIAVDRPIYSFLTCCRSEETLKVFPSKILLIDGILALSDPELRNLMNVKIYLSVSEHNRLLRIIDRDISERSRTKKMAEKRFYETVKPMHDIFVEPFKKNANELLNGDSENINHMVHALEKIIQQCLEHKHEAQ